MVQYTLKQLAYFIAAAEHQSVTGAARALNLSQPSVSAAIAHLERVLNTQLFMRHHAQGLSLTPAGRRLFAEGRSLLAQADELMAPPGSDAEPLRGELDLGCFLTFSPYYIPGLLWAFRRQHPAVELRLHEGDTEMLHRGLASGAVDLAILYDLGLGPSFVRETLAELPAYALLPRAHRLARARTVSLAALAAEPFVLLDLPHSRDYFQSIFLRYGLEPDIRYRTTSYEMVRGLVAHGHGVGLLNLRLPRDESYDGQPIACRSLREPAAPLRLVLAHAGQVRPTRAADAFAAVAREHFRRAAPAVRYDSKKSFPMTRPPRT
jgi:DNA-binding transcriptional LysR family regulator